MHIPKASFSPERLISVRSFSFPPFPCPPVWVRLIIPDPSWSQAGDSRTNRLFAADVSIAGLGNLSSYAVFPVTSGCVNLPEGLDRCGPTSLRGRRATRCPKSHGAFQRDEASKRTEDQTWSRIPVTGFECEVAYRAGRRGAGMNGAFGWIPCERISTLQTFEKGRGDRSDRSRGTKRGGTTIRFASSVDGMVDTGDPGHQGRSRTLVDRPNRPRHVRRV
jgi:hypothetical protein